MATESVRLAVIFDDEHGYEPNFMTSYMQTLGHDLATTQRLAMGGWMFKHAKGYDVAQARNEVVAEFLATDVDWLWFVDSDMGWEQDALDRLMASADPDERPIVGGLCFGYTPVEDGAGEANGPLRFPFPTVYDLVEEDDDIGFRVRWAYRPNALQRCGATGAAMLLVHRSALERIAEHHGQHWFSRIKHPKAKKMWGEDTSFCVRAGTAGLPVHVDTRVRTSHLKPLYVSELTYMRDIQAPPADDEIDVIVPVLHRPHHAEPFMRSLRASTGLAHATAVCTTGDDEAIEAWEKAGADVLVTSTGRSTFACKVNDGYRATRRPWMLLVGSDVAFRPAWWDHALQAARVHRASVVATNDIINGDVRDGLLATHPVIARSYVDGMGASWDGPGLVAHEGYKHWWVDTEWSTVARQRNEMVTARAAVVEHLHPIAGTAPTDDVYELGAKFQSLDKETFQRRFRRFGRVEA